MSIKQTSKNRFRHLVMWAALALIISLFLLSIYGAFLGAERAKDFFNSLPMTAYWLALAALLIIAIAIFRRLVRVPGLLLMHAGCILILAGSMWGSNAAHKLRKQLFGIDKIQKASMTIIEGQSESSVVSENNKLKELPFSVKLKDFRIEYYKPQYLQVRTHHGRGRKIPVEIDTEFSLGPELGTVKIIRAFENFKITIDGDSKTAIDDLRPGSNPALHVRLKDPNGTVTTKYVFERFPDHLHPEDKFLLSYHRTVSDYISDIQIIEDGKVVAEKSIEVNHPLYFGGYHFYQHSYDAQAGRYTVLMVVSDTGLNLLYAGYLMLCLGVFQHLWLRHTLAKTKSQHAIQKNGN